MSGHSLTMNIKQGMAIAIAKRRAKLQISQGELSRRLGCTRASVSLWETGNTSPRLQDLPELAEVLETTPVRLLALAVRFGGTK